MSSKETRDRLAELRAAMAANGLDWYIINGTDAHLSEYVAPYWRTRAFISGFTGSAGTVLVSKDGAWLWTDSRYFIQAASQIDELPVVMSFPKIHTGIAIAKPDVLAVLPEAVCSVLIDCHRPDVGVAVSGHLAVRADHNISTHVIESGLF